MNCSEGRLNVGSSVYRNGFLYSGVQRVQRLAVGVISRYFRIVVNLVIL